MTLSLLSLLLLAPSAVPWHDFETAPALTLGGEGVQPESAARLTADPVHAGRWAARLDYKFITDPKGLQYVGFGLEGTLPMRPGGFAVWVYGDGGRQQLNVRLVDASGETHQFQLGRIAHTGWRQMKCRVHDGGLAWGGDANKRLDPPLQMGLLLIDSSVRPGEGTVVFDDLSLLPETGRDPAWAEPLPLPAAPTLDGVARQPGSRVQAVDGGLRLDYEFSDAAAGQYLVVPLDLPLPRTAALALWLEADSGGQILRYQFRDAHGETHQVTAGELLWQGLARVETALEPKEHWGGDANQKVDYPLRLTALVLDRRKPGKGSLTFRRLTALPARGPAVAMQLQLRRGDEPPPRLAGPGLSPETSLTVDPAAAPNGAWKLSYRFAAEPATQYAEIPLNLPLGEQPKPLRLRIRGDGTANDLRLRVSDAKGEVHQFVLATLANREWHEISTDFTGERGTWSGDGNQVIDGAVNLISLLVDSRQKPSAGTLWIDYLATEVSQPEADALSLEIAPAAARDWLFDAAEPASLTLTWRDRRVAAGDQTLPLRLVIRDPRDKVLLDERREVPLVGGTGACRVELPAGQPGYQAVTAIWRAGEDFAVRETGIARLPALPESNLPTNPFGACLHYAQHKGIVPLNYDLLRAAGGRWARDEYTWSTVEPRPGVYQFPDYYDHYLKQARQRGVEPLIILDYGNANYDGGLSPTSETAQKAFAEYAYQMVSRYRGICDTWEVYNEPNIGFWKPKPDAAAYTRLLKLTYAACKRANPDCTVVGICTAGVDFSYIEAVLKEGGGPYMDGLSVHPYRYPTSPEAGNFVGDLRKLHELMSRYGIGEKPIWLTEIGWPNHTESAGVSEEVTANYLVRMVSLARSLPYVGPIMWYDLQNDGTNPTYNENNFGLIRLDYSPKQPFVAAAMMNRLLAAKGFARVVDSQLPVYAHEYEGGGQRTVVLWSTPDPTTVTLEVGAASVELSDVTGALRTVATTNGSLTLELDERPVFVSGSFGPTRLHTAP